jgi:hypothetical protein
MSGSESDKINLICQNHNLQLSIITNYRCELNAQDDMDTIDVCHVLILSGKTSFK